MSFVTFSRYFIIIRLASSIQGKSYSFCQIMLVPRLGYILKLGSTTLKSAYFTHKIFIGANFTVICDCLRLLNHREP